MSDLASPGVGSGPRDGVVVVGSANLDVVVTVDRLPVPGETVMGGDVLQVAGGKGLNQAVAVARVAGAALVASVGDDDAGGLLVSALEQAGVDTRYVGRVVAAATGRAFIQVASDGENSIVVAAAANRLLRVEDVSIALDALRPAIVLAQLEVPLDSVLAAAGWARDNNARFALNPSPVCELPGWLLELCDPLVANVIEAAQILNTSPEVAAADLALALARRTVSAVVTDGSRGAYIGTSQGVVHVPASPVDAVDTTGAGDEFTGRLVGELVEGQPLAVAVTSANLSAARLVTLPRHRRSP